MSPFSMDYCLRNISYNIVAFVTQYHIFENQPLFYDKLFPFNIATQTPPLFSKPFTGIYLFAPQKDKCHSNFEKYLNAQVYMSFFTTYPHWEQSLFQKLSQELLLLKPQKQFLLVCCKIMYNVATQQLTRRSQHNPLYRCTTAHAA